MQVFSRFLPRSNNGRASCSTLSSPGFQVSHRTRQHPCVCQAGILRLAWGFSVRHPAVLIFLGVPPSWPQVSDPYCAQPIPGLERANIVYKAKNSTSLSPSRCSSIAIEHQGYRCLNHLTTHSTARLYVILIPHRTSTDRAYV